MESQKRLLDQSSSSSFLGKRMKMNNSINNNSCSVDESLITSTNLNVYATYQQQNAPPSLMMGNRKRVFEDSISQPKKRSKQSLTLNLESSIYHSANDTFITSKDIHVCGTFQPTLLPSLVAAGNELNITELRTSFQSLTMCNDKVSPDTTLNETMIRSTNIDTRGTYQQLSSVEFDPKAVNRLFHGIEAMTSLDHSEFNSLEMSGGTLIPDVDASEKYQSNIFWTSAQEDPGHVTEYKTLNHSEELVDDDNLVISNSIPKHMANDSVAENIDSDLNSYKCGSCDYRCYEFSQLMVHDCHNQVSGTSVLPLTSTTSKAFLTSTRNDLASCLPKWEPIQYFYNKHNC